VLCKDGLINTLLRIHNGMETIQFRPQWFVFMTEVTSVYCAVRTESFKYNELRSILQRLNVVAVHKYKGTDIMKHTAIQIT